MNLFNESRPINVYVDGVEIATDNRIMARGRSNMTLLPDFFLVDIYNLTAYDASSLQMAKKISVYVNKFSLVCSGDIEGVYTHDVESNRVTTISVSDGMDFWNSKVNMSIGKGSFVKDALLMLLDEKKLGAFTSHDIRFQRGQTFCGGIMDYINDMAKSLNARAFITKDVLFVVEKGQIYNKFVLDENNIITTPSYTGDTIILKTYVNGYGVGSIIEYNGKQYRIITQAINLDNMQGDWNTEMILVDENNITIEEMGGGW